MGVVVVDAGVVVEEDVLCFFPGRLGDGYVAGVVRDDSHDFVNVLVKSCPCQWFDEDRGRGPVWGREGV